MKPVITAINKSTHSLFEWEEARKRKALQVSGSRSVEVWHKPDRGEFMCNVDVAIFAEEGCYGIGICVRNDKGAFVKA